MSHWPLVLESHVFCWAALPFLVIACGGDIELGPVPASGGIDSIVSGGAHATGGQRSLGGGSTIATGGAITGTSPLITAVGGTAAGGMSGGAGSTRVEASGGTPNGGAATYLTVAGGTLTGGTSWHVTGSGGITGSGGAASGGITGGSGGTKPALAGGTTWTGTSTTIAATGGNSTGGNATVTPAGGTCAAGYLDCDANPATICESHVISDVSNCGSCGTRCSLPNATPACVTSQCVIAMCNAGYADCDDEPSNGCEVNSSIALNNCGSCGNVCAMPHTIPMCVNGTCVIGACDNGFADCDGNPSNGCEVNLLVDLNHCGACGAHCPTGCISGICPLPCSPPFAECDGDASNGCETNLMTDPANCGACGVDCSELDAGTCHNGTCD